MSAPTYRIPQARREYLSDINNPLHTCVKITVVRICSRFSEDEIKCLLLSQIINIKNLSIARDCMNRVRIVRPNNLRSYFDIQRFRIEGISLTKINDLYV